MSVFDVAAYVLEQQGGMSAMKLQKLVYYCQAWHLVWEDEELFDERIEAWANGPVSPDLYAEHRGVFRVSPGAITRGGANNLAAVARESVDLVLGFYGDKSAQWLSDLTHMEDPWMRARARAGAPAGALCDEEITLEDMSEFYSSIPPNCD